MRISAPSCPTRRPSLYLSFPLRTSRLGFAVRMKGVSVPVSFQTLPMRMYDTNDGTDFLPISLSRCHLMVPPYPSLSTNFGQNGFTFLAGNVKSLGNLARGQWRPLPVWAKKRSRRVRGRENVRESGIVLADCVSSPRSSHRTSFAQEVQEVQEGRRKEMLLLTQQRQLFEVKRPTDRPTEQSN